MKVRSAIGFKIVCLLCVFAPALHADEAADRAWVDELWRNHILWRAEYLLSDNPVFAESLSREVLKVDPVNRRAMDILSRVYADKGEPAMLAMTCLLGMTLFPEDAAWPDTFRLAEQRIRDLPSAPPDSVLAISTNKFNVYLNEAVRTRERDRNLMISEVALRALLIDYPLNSTLLEELSVNYRLAGEWTLCAMVNRLGVHAYPDNPLFFRPLVESLRLMGRGDLGWSKVKEAVDSGRRDDELIQLVCSFGVSAGQGEALDELLAEVTAEVPDDDLLGVARALMAERQLPAAIPPLSLLHERAPERFEPVYDLAVIHGLMGDEEASRQWLEELQVRVGEERFAEMVAQGPFSESVQGQFLEERE